MIPFSLQKNPILITELRDDMKAECEKYGEVRKVIVFDVSRFPCFDNTTREICMYVESKTTKRAILQFMELWRLIKEITRNIMQT